MANTNLVLSGLDFEAVKLNLKNYLKRSDSPFRDVDFEGSTINSLLDVLAYNTYQNNFYLNMVASEMFLDSSTLRDSVISHAKELNYVPRSFRSSEAVLSFWVKPATDVSSIIVPKGTSFSSKVGSNTYTFTVNENFVVSSNSTGFLNANNVTVYEGIYITDSFIYNSSDQDERFILSNPTIDTRSLTVLVLENSGANVTTFNRATSFLGNDANSNIYFLQPAENDQYELIFGDNIIGRKPLNGSTIIAEYRVCSGELPNSASLFFPDGPIQGHSNISSISTISSARNGAISESIQSIKYSAPRSFQNQDRAVVASDYENLLKINFPEIQAVSAYGGEEVEPPEYGRVFIAVDVYGSDGSPTSLKDVYKNFIKERTPIGIDPVIVDPEFMYLDLEVGVRYSTKKTNFSTTQIETLIKNNISNYNLTYLEDFKKTARPSKIIERLNAVDYSILGVDLTIRPFFKLDITPGTSFTEVFQFKRALERYTNIAQSADRFVNSTKKSVYSSTFTYNLLRCFLLDDGEGNIGIYNIEDSGNTSLVVNVGNVDYNTGSVSINNLTVTEYSGGSLNLYVEPIDRDISSDKNTILKIDDRDIVVTVTALNDLE